MAKTSKESDSNLSAAETAAFAHIQEGRGTAALEAVRSGDVRVNCVDDSGMSLLDQAAFKGDETLAAALLAVGADADNRRHAHGYTCLMFAALAGKPRLCEMLLNAGARSYATNKIGKTAAEMAAFVGNYECVSVINSYISREDVERIVNPNGAASSEVFPAAFVDHAHALTRTHNIHPITIARGLGSLTLTAARRKKLVFVIDCLFERQLRSKEPNEVLSLKLWLVLATLRETFKFVDKKLAAAESSENEAAAYEASLRSFEQTLAEWQETAPESGGGGRVCRARLERYLVTAVEGFPYRQSLVFKALAHSIRGRALGAAPAAYVLVCATLLGQRFAYGAFCSLCGTANARSCCARCKILYCSPQCQKLDWPSHRHFCERLARDNKCGDAYKRRQDAPDIAQLTLNSDGDCEGGQQTDVKQAKLPT